MLVMEKERDVVLRRLPKVSLRGPKPPPPPSTREATKPKNFRLPLSLLAYLRTNAKQLGRTQTDILIGAVRLDRDLPAELGEEYRQRLEAFAARLGLDMDTGLAKVLAVAIRKGLDCQDVDCLGAGRARKAKS